MTCLGELSIRRRWWQCFCAAEPGSCLCDTLLGIAGRFSKLLQRKLCFVAADMSFARTREQLIELLGVTLAEEAIRQCAESHGRHMQGWQSTDQATCDTFATTEGELEFLVDAGKVNTRERGWRDLKIGCFQKRPLGPPATAADWAKRELPEATSRVAFAGIASAKRFRASWRGWAGQLGIRWTRELHALGDGARWIWRSLESQLGGCRQTLDVFHALEHLADAGRKLYGEETPEAKEFLERGRPLLLEKGWAGVTELMGHEITRSDTPARRQILEKMLGYFSQHVGRMNYAANLQEGRAIGSGPIEGWAKTLGLRLKARGARWRQTNADAMATAGCVRHTPQWAAYWSQN